MKRKMLASILALAMMLTMLPATAWAAEAADSGEAAAEAEPIAPAEEPEEPEQPEAALLQARIDALPEADEVAALMESDPAAVDAVYEEVCALMGAVEALDGALDTARLDALVALFTPEAELLAGVECPDGETCQQHEAAIGSKHYDTLTAAVSAGSGKVVTLLKDARVTAKKNLTRYTYTIDLNNHNIAFAESCYFKIYSGATLNLTGAGKLYEEVPTYSPIVINGSTTGKTTFNVGKDVILEGFYGGYIDKSSSKNQNIIVNVEGTLIGSRDANGQNGAGFYIHGNFKNMKETTVPQITITETAKISGAGCGIYAAGYANWNLAGNVTGNAGEALSIKSGTFNITGGTYTAKGAFVDPAAANSNGSESTGAALSITSNDDYAPKTVVNVTGGTFISENGYAVYEGIAQANGAPAAAASYATLNISGGTFNGNADKGAASITEAESKKIITSGTFSSDVSEYVGPGYACKQSSDAANTYIVAPITAEDAKVSVTSAEGISYYASLEDAVAAAEDGDTVTLLKTVEAKSQLTVNKNLTLDINQQGFSSTATYAVCVTSGKSFTIKNGTLNANGGGAAIAALKGTTVTVAADAILESAGDGVYGTNDAPDEGNATFNIYGTLNCGGIGVFGQGPNNTYNIEGATINSEYWGVYQKGTFGGAQMTIKDSTITDTSDESIGVYISNGSATGELQTLYIENSVITAETAVEVKYTNVIITGDKTCLTATVSPATMVEESSGSVSLGYAFAATHNGTAENSGDSACGSIVIEGGCFKGEVGIQEPVGSKENAATIAISSGYYTTDVTKYCVAGKMAIDNPDDNQATYAYKIGDIVEQELPDVKDAAISGETTAAVGTGIASDDAAAAQTVAESVKPDNLPVSAVSEATKKSEDSEAVVKLKANGVINVAEDGEITDASGKEATVTVVRETYLDVEITSYTNTVKEQEITLEIEPKYNLFATIDTVSADIDSDSLDESITVAIEQGKPLTVTDPVEITVNLPDNFAEGTAYVEHTKADGTVYIYTGTVTSDGTNKVLTFTNPNGFSTFRVVAKNPAAAVVKDAAGNVLGNYPTFQAAVDAVQEGETVQILKASTEGYSASAEKTVTVENLSGSKLQVTCSGETAAIPAGESHTFTYVAPTPVWPPYVPPIIPVVPAQPAAPASELPFVDVSVQDAFYEAVKYVYNNGLMTGVDTTVFAPYGDFTRAQVATILFRLEAEPVTPFAAIFPDVTEGQWFAQAITWGNSKSILLGYDDGTFGPDNAVTMEQLLTILYRYAGLKGYDTEARADITGFDCADYAAEAVSWAAAHGMVDASNATTLRATAARWQVAQVLSVFCQTVVLR